MFNLIVLLTMAVVLAMIIVQMVLAYRAAEGSTWKRLLAGARNSATWLWGKVLLVAGLMLEGADYAAQYFSLPEVQTFIQTHVSAARLGTVLLVVGVVTLLARLRSIVRSVS